MFSKFSILIFALFLSGCGGGSSGGNGSENNNPPNSPPIVNAGPDQMVASGAIVQLDGSQSQDLNNQILSFQWTQTFGTSVNLSDNTVDRPVFTAPIFRTPLSSDERTLIFELTASDGIESRTDLITVEVNSSPTVAINPQSDVSVGATVQLSQVSSGSITAVQWEQVSGASIGQFETTNSSATIVMPLFETAERLTFKVTVTDDEGYTASDQVSFQVHIPSATNRGKTIWGSPSRAGVDLVIIGDGYLAGELPAFHNHVKNFVDYFFTTHPINVHQNAWNIHTIEITSNESGADFPSTNTYRDTALDARYDCNGTARLICISRSKVYAEVLDEYPQYDQIIVFVNEDTYGGAGISDISIASVHPRSYEVAIHEMGHTLAGLGDEYEEGSLDPLTFEPNRPNITIESNPAEVKWHYWIADTNDVPSNSNPLGKGNIGLFEGAFYREVDVYRPTSNSIMRGGEYPFYEVNAEAWAINVYRLSSPIRAHQPYAVDGKYPGTVGEAVTFEITPSVGLEAQDIEWMVNGFLFPNDPNDPFTFTCCQNLTQNYIVSATISDSSGVIRRDNIGYSEEIIEWLIEVN